MFVSIYIYPAIMKCKQDNGFFEKVVGCKSFEGPLSFSKSHYQVVY